MMHGELVGRLADAIAVLEGAVEALDQKRTDIDEDVDQAVDEVRRRLAEVHAQFVELEAALDDGGGADEPELDV